MASDSKIGIVGYKFMGKAHSNAYHKAEHFFNLPMRPLLKVACGRHESQLNEFLKNWGWQEAEASCAKKGTFYFLTGGGPIC